MGGSIEAESELGRGSRFAMRLPSRVKGSAGALEGSKGLSCVVDAASSERRKILLADVAASGVSAADKAADEAKARREGMASEGASLNGPKKTILIVEDNDDLLLELLRRDRRISLVVSDIMMPGMGGKELLARMREDARYAGLPFVFLTARASEEEKIESLGDGAADYLVRPFRPEELLAKVEAVLTVREEGLREAERRIKRALYDDERPGGRDIEAELRRLDLPERELAVARILAQGKGDKEIADELGCSPRTVSNRVASILRKTGARGRAEFIASLGKG